MEGRKKRRKLHESGKNKRMTNRKMKQKIKNIRKRERDVLKFKHLEQKTQNGNEQINTE